MQFRVVIIAFILCFFLSSFARANGCTKVIATAHPEYPPYHWKEGDKIVGASVELTAQIFKELGVEFEARSFGPWKRVLSGAQNNRFDMVLALKKTPERMGFLDFTSEPILPNPFAIFVLEENKFRFQSWYDLLDRTGGKNAGDRYGGAFDKFADQYLNLERGYSTESNIKKLLSNRIDYYIHGRYVGLAHFASTSLSQKIVALDKNINEGYIHSGFTKKSPCNQHLTYVSQRYQEMMANGEAEQALYRNLKNWKIFATGKQLH